jgi:hypothetical protein
LNAIEAAMTSMSFRSRFLLFSAVVGAGAVALASVLERLMGVQSLAASVAVKLGAVTVASGLAYLIAPDALKTDTLVTMSKRTTLIIVVAGLIVLIGITIWSHEWALSVGVLVTLAILVIGLLWRTLKLQDQVHATQSSDRLLR